MITITKNQLIWFALSVVILFAGALLSTCTDKENSGESLQVNSSDQKDLVSKGKFSAERLEQAERWYTQSCQLCHGVEREGRFGHPKLADIHKKYKTEDIYDIIINGKGDMAGGFLQGIEAKTVAEWLVEVLPES